MQDVLSYIFPATSIILLSIIFANILLKKRKRALERELSFRRADLEKEYREKREQLERKERELFQEQREALEEELRQKRLQHDQEMLSKQEQLNHMLEKFKTAKLGEINREIDSFREEMKGRMSILEADAKAKMEEYQKQLAFEESKIMKLRRNQEEITDTLRRKAIENDEYNIQISEEDRIEVKELQTIANRYTRIRPIILKAVYDVYYLPEVKKLVSRVVGKDKICGIYRITSKIDGRIYIGKSVDIKTRWMTHFKRAAGIETETTNLLYPAMRAQGLENFSFEIIEKVEDSNELSSREKYWQEFYSAKEHGFSVK